MTTYTCPARHSPSPYQSVIFNLQHRVPPADIQLVQQTLEITPPKLVTFSSTTVATHQRIALSQSTSYINGVKHNHQNCNIIQARCSMNRSMHSSSSSSSSSASSSYFSSAYAAPSCSSSQRAPRVSIKHLPAHEREQMRRKLNAEAACRSRQRRKMEEKNVERMYRENEERIAALERRAKELTSELLR